VAVVVVLDIIVLPAMAEQPVLAHYAAPPAELVQIPVTVILADMVDPDLADRLIYKVVAVRGMQTVAAMVVWAEAAQAILVVLKVFSIIMAAKLVREPRAQVQVVEIQMAAREQALAVKVPVV
jgi:hypothetical protein